MDNSCLIGFDASVIRGRRTGVENYAFRLLEALRQLPDAPRIAAFSNQPVEGVPEIIVKSAPLPLAAWRQLILPGLARQAGVTSFHSPVTAIPLILTVPVVATLHDAGFFTVPACYRLRERLSQSFWLRAALARAAAAVCVSETTKAHIAARFPNATGRMHAVLSGALAMPSPQSAPPAALPGIHQPFALCVGRLERRKNPVRTLEAFLTATAAPEFRNYTLVFAGQPGNAAGDLAAAIARHPEAAGRVMVLEYVTADTLAGLYRAADLLLYLSLDEGFGHPPFEALAAGTPVVAADIPVLREILADAATFAPPEDIPAMAAAIRRLIAEPALRKAQLAAGQQRLAARSWQQTASKIVALHRSLTKNGGANSARF